MKAKLMMSASKKQESHFDLEILLISENLMSLDKEKAMSILSESHDKETIAKLLNADIYYASNHGLNESIYPVLLDQNVSTAHLFDYFCYLNGSKIEVSNKKLNPVIVPFYLYVNNLKTEDVSQHNLFNQAMLKALNSDSVDTYFRRRKPAYDKLHTTNLNALYVLKLDKSLKPTSSKRKLFKVIANGK